MSEKSYLYEFKMALFDNGDPEEFLLFISNFITTLEGVRNARFWSKDPVSSYSVTWRSVTSD